MIFKLIALLMLSFLFIQWGKPPESEKNLPYKLIDEIASERERVKNIEDLISVIEAYKDDPEHEEFSIAFTAPNGGYRFDVFSSDELLTYLYSERKKSREEMSIKIRKISN